MLIVLCDIMIHSIILCKCTALSNDISKPKYRHLQTRNELCALTYCQITRQVVLLLFLFPCITEPSTDLFVKCLKKSALHWWLREKACQAYT